VIHPIADCFHPSFNRVLESHFQSQKDCYEKEIEGLNFKVVHLSQEINHLQKLFREETDINESIRHEVTRLTSENMVWPLHSLLVTIVPETLFTGGAKNQFSAAKQLILTNSLATNN
jgi:hypothetical protein